MKVALCEVNAVLCPKCSTNQRCIMGTSEFAKACGVPKDTLFHYDRIGILKPEYVNDKGYRFYSVKQFVTYDIITTLQKAGSPLSEIKAYLENKNPSQFLSIVKQKKEQLILEQQKIKRMERLLQTTYDMVENALNVECYIPSIEELDEEYLITVALTSEGIEKQDVQRMGEHYIYCTVHQIAYEYPVGTIITKSHIEQGIYNKPDYYFNKLTDRLTDSINNERVHIRPKGKYAVINHKGSYGSLPESYEILCNYIKEQHMTVVGNSYEQEILTYLAIKNSDEYIIRIAIQIG